MFGVRRSPRVLLFSSRLLRLFKKFSQQWSFVKGRSVFFLHFGGCLKKGKHARGKIIKINLSISWKIEKKGENVNKKIFSEQWQGKWNNVDEMACGQNQFFKKKRHVFFKWDFMTPLEETVCVLGKRRHFKALRVFFLNLVSVYRGKRKLALL